MAFDAPEYFNRYAYYKVGKERSLVIWKDDFEATKLKWQKGLFGSLERCLTEAKVGEASMLLTSPADSTKDVSATVRIGAPVPGLTGFDFFFNLAHTNEVIFTIEFYLWYYTGMQQTDIRYLSASDKWQYWDDVTSAWVDIPNSSQKLAATEVIWNRARLLVDFVNAKYVMFECGTLRLALDTYPLPTVAASYRDYLSLAFILAPTTNTAEKVYIDDVIVFGQEGL